VAQAETPLPRIFFGGQAEVLGRGAGGDDQRVAGVGAGIADQRERASRQLRGVDVVEDDFGIEAAGMGFEARHQLRALDAVGIGRPVVDFGRRHQLAALGHAGDQHRLEVGAGGIDGGGVTGGAGTENDEGLWRGLGHGGCSVVVNGKIISSNPGRFFPVPLEILN
jgi:hypothetical protein